MRRRTFLSVLGVATATAGAGRVAADRDRPGTVIDDRTAETADRAIAGTDGTIAKLAFPSGCGLLGADGSPLTEDSLVAVFAEPTAEVRDRDGNGDATTYPDGEPIPLVAVDGGVVGVGAPLVNDGDLVPELAGDDPLVDLGNEEFLLNAYDEYVDGDTIVWDESHGQFYDLGRFRNFESYAESNGYTLRATGDLTGDLADADAVVITSPSSSFSEAELSALSSFVDDGGAVFLHDQSDFNDFDETGNLNAVADRLGAGFRFDDGEVGDAENNLGVAYLPTTANFNDDFGLFADREGITVDLRRGERYEVSVEDVADGDTFDVRFAGDDVGLETDYLATVRVLGIDTPESASVAATAERPEEWEGLAYGADDSSIRRLKFDSTASLLAADGTPLTDDESVLVEAEATAGNEDSDGNGDAVDYPDDEAIPLIALDGSVMGVGAPFLDDGSFAPSLGNEEFMLNAYDELVDGDTILWDGSHDQFYTVDRFGDFASVALENGYTLRGTDDLSGDIDDADAVVITSPSAAFTDAELSALSSFVEEGGAVFLHDQADFRDFDETANLNEVAAALEVGFRFNDDQVVDDENNTGERFRPTTSNFDDSSPYFEDRAGADGSAGENTTAHLLEWAGNASSFAEDALAGETVELSFDESEPLRDPTRLLAYAEYDGDGDGSVDTLYNREVIEKGYARAYGSSLSRHDDFRAAEAAARSDGRGVWSKSDISAATPYRNREVAELFAPTPAAVRTASGGIDDRRVPLAAAETASYDGGDVDYGGAAPLAGVDIGNSVAMVGSLLIDESYEREEGYPVDTAGYDNFPFLTTLLNFLTDREGDVLIDGGHGQFGVDWALSSEDAAYYQRHLEGEGYGLEQVNDPTPEKLRSGRAYIVTTPVSAFSDAELSAVRTFRDEGGAVILLGSAAAPRSALSNLDDVAAGLDSDLRIGGGRVTDGTNNLNDDPTVPTTTTLSDSVPMFGGPVDRADDDDDGAVDDSELRTAITEWAGGKFDDDDLREIITAWATGG